MLSYDNCPNNLPCMPDYPTVNGVPMNKDKIETADEYSKRTGIGIWYVNPTYMTAGAVANPLPSAWVETISGYYNPYIERVKSTMYLPTLCAIGLSEALCEVEKVLAWNQTEKHPNAKWKTKSIDWHDSKCVSHLNQAQCGDLVDSETKCRHRAHAICRLLMSLQRELKG